MFTLLVPLATFPYLIRVLGNEIYGLVIYAQVIVSYLQIIVNFGFNTSALKAISVNREDKQTLGKIISSIYILKGSLLFLSFGVLFIIINFLPEAKENKLLFLLSMWACLSDFAFPIWYFQGVEKMKYITYLTVITRSIFLASVFVFITKTEHYLRLPIINGIGSIVLGILSIFILYRYEKIKLRRPSAKLIYEQLRNSKNFFISEVSVNVFASSNKLIIGTFLGLTELAYYDMAERIINIFRGIPLNIVKTTIFPVVAKTRNLNLVKQVSIIMGLYSLIAIAFINIFAAPIIVLFGGREMLPSIVVVRIFSILIFTTHISNYYITVGLWSLGHDRIFRNLMIYSSLIFILIYFVLGAFQYINLYTITIAPIMVDIYLTVHTYFVYKSLNPHRYQN